MTHYFFKNTLLGVFSIFLLNINSYAQDTSNFTQRSEDFSPKDFSRSLTLKEVIDEGLRKNPDEKVRTFDRSLLELGWKDTYEDFWFPKIQLYMNTTTGQRIDKWRTGGDGATDSSGQPTGSFGLELGEYTLFNWGRDYLDYLNARESFSREKTELNEKRRELKLNIINHYFQLALSKKKLKIMREQLRHATFVYRMGREKASIKKLSRQEYYQARTEYLRAQQEYHEAKLNSELEDEKFALFIGDDLANRYKTRDRLVFKPLRMQLEKSLQKSLERSPMILTAKTAMFNSQRKYQKSLKDDLPLPKLSLNLGTYANNFSKDSFQQRYTTDGNSKNLELKASIDATWTIKGSGGFLNGRKRKMAMINKQRAERVYYDKKRYVETEIRKIHSQILSLERRHEIAQSKFKNAQKSFENHLQNYLKGRIKFDDFKDALINQKDSEVQLHEIKYLHLYSKIHLAQLVGVEGFPGENFEEIARTEVR